MRGEKRGNPPTGGEAEGAAEGATDWPTYHLFGVTLATDRPLRTSMRAASGRAPDLVFRRVDEPLSIPDVPPTFVSPLRLDSGDSFLRLYRTEKGDLMRFTEVADYLLGTRMIEAHLLDPAYDFALEIHLLGILMAYWLERTGRPVLHASAVAVEGRAVAFLATNQGGKSSLAAMLMEAGHPLLTDDLLCIEQTEPGIDASFLALPGYPQMRMWPDLATHFLGSWEGLEKVHPKLEKRRVPVGPEGFGAFAAGPAPLARLLVPHRRDDGSDRVEIVPFSPRDAVLELVRGTFLPRTTEAAGFQEKRMGRFFQLADEVPMRRVTYPAGFDSLDTVRSSILADLDGP